MTIWTILLALLLLSLLVMFHELGHYAVGRLFKFTIKEFSIGMGPKILYKRSKKTGIIYSLRAFPIGGMCEFGEDDTEDKSLDNPNHFDNKAWWKRALVLVAGAFMNFIIAFVLAVALLGIYGQYDQSQIQISAVDAGSPAAAAGVKQGDVLVSINGVEINGDASLDSGLQMKKDEARVVVDRDGELVTLNFQGLYNEEKGKNFMGVGIGAKHIEHSFFGAVAAAPKYCVNMIKQVYQSLWMLVSGSASLNEAAGPAGILMMMGEYIPQGLEVVLIILVMISVNLGVINLLPLPALDGGRLVLVVIEGITKKRLPKSVEAIVHFVGFALLLLLIIVLTYNDIASCIRR